MDDGKANKKQITENRLLVNICFIKEKVKKKYIGDGQSVYIIAEMLANYNMDLKREKNIINTALHSFVP